MKNFLAVIATTIVMCSCVQKEGKVKPEPIKMVESNSIVGTWRLVYGEVKEKDSVTIKDLGTSEFIKIINNTHFAFFNQKPGTAESFYGGAGTYSLKGTDYIETLDFIGVENIRGHQFPFTIEVKGDSLIQHGLEEVKEANIKRYIIEKYIRVK